MYESIVLEISLLIKACITGALLMCAYDILRAYRRIVIHNVVAVGIEDVLYWIAAGIIVFMLLYGHNNGTVRGFIIAFVVIGMLLFEWLLGRWIIKIVNLLVKPLQKICKRYKINKCKAQERHNEKKILALREKELRSSKVKDKKKSKNKKSR